MLFNKYRLNEVDISGGNDDIWYDDMGNPHYYQSTKSENIEKESGD